MNARTIAVEAIKHLREASVALIRLSSVASKQSNIIDIEAWSQATAFMTRKLDSLITGDITYDYGVQDIKFKVLINYEVCNEKP